MAFKSYPLSSLNAKKEDPRSFKNSVETLLKAEEKINRTVGLLSLYGNLYYDWDIEKDLIQWRGPASLLFGTKSDLFSGDVFLRRLPLEDFNARMEALGRCLKQKTPLKTQFHLHWQEDLYSIVQEQATIFFKNQEIPHKIRGTIKILPQVLSKPSPVLSKDAESSILSYEDLQKSLDSLIAKGEEEETSGAYLAISLDRMTQIVALSGQTGLGKVVKFITETLRQNIRTHDTMGRISGNTFGIILYNCDRWGIASASQRLLGKIQETQLQIGEKTFPLSISSGGVIFPCEGLKALDLMKEAESALEDAQNIKGVTRFWTPSLLKGPSEPEPIKDDAPKGQQRRTDNPARPSSSLR